ncbi:MAG: prolipoprotein diacylglyceryl transferase [Bradymonadales bacterium]|jgi:phosphatidylglycerol:prolipoprotein diacylglycerol transferase
MLVNLFTSLAAIQWDWDPAIFKAGPIELRYYGVLFALALAVGYITLRWRFRDENEDPEGATGITYALMAAIVLGARLAHVFFYDRDYYFMNPGEILKFWKGGLASHGAATGIILVCLFYSYIYRREPVRVILDRMSFTIPFAAICVRLGNFFNSEIIGSPTDVPWAVVFVRVDSIPRHPSQIYESSMGIILIAIIFGTYYLYKRRNKPMPLGLASSLLLTGYFTMRFFVEFFKEAQTPDVFGALSMGQALSLPFISLGLVGVALCLFGPWKKQNAMQYTKRFQLPAETAESKEQA